MGAFCPSALAALERELLAHLTFIAALAIGREFYQFRFDRAPASAMETLWRRQPKSTEIYSAFVDHMRTGGLLDLLDACPVLARLLCQSVDQWVRMTVALCRRFSQDFAELRTFFGWRISSAEGAVANLRTGLSDRHDGGQTVLGFILSSGERVIYKPRTVQPEIAFYDFVGWLNQCELSLDLKTIGCLDRVTHGWVEWVPAEVCQSDVEIERFYQRAGMLLAVLHALATTDIHCENLIASGEHPVVVDLETMLNESVRELQPNLTDDDTSPAAPPSVLTTSMLPQWQTAPDGRQFDMSALGSDNTQDPGIRASAWVAINTDQMMLADESTVSASDEHRARLAGRSVTVLDHLPQLIDGFKEVYEHLLANRERLLSDAQLLDRFDKLELRILVRSTVTYTRLHLHLLHPEFLRDGLDRSIELEWLARPLSATPQPQPGRIRLYECERAAMENLDIPHFAASSWRNMGTPATPISCSSAATGTPEFCGAGWRVSAPRIATGRSESSRTPCGPALNGQDP